MSTLALFRRAMLDTWRSSLGWGAAMVAPILLYFSFYPSFGGESSEMEALIESLPPQMIATLGFDQIGSGPGYAQATFFGLLGFVFITIASSSWGAAMIAGDEENGPLELTLAHGVTRTQLYGERAAAVATRLVWLGLVAFVMCVLVSEPFELGLEPGMIFAACAALIGLGFLSGSIALAVGAATGRRAYAVGAGAGVAILGYVLNAVANQGTEADGLHAFSPFAWAYQNSPLINGVDGGGLAVLFGVSALAFVGGLLVFRRRDVAV